MENEFTIKYRFHWCGPCLKDDDTKTETIIHSDGTVLARNYDHHGANGHYRLVERASGFVSKEDAKRLYQDLLNLVQYHDEQIAAIPDAVAEAIIEAPGIKIAIDAGISNGEVYCGGMIDKVLNSIEMKWESVIRSA